MGEPGRPSQHGPGLPVDWGMGGEIAQLIPDPPAGSLGPDALLFVGKYLHLQVPRPWGFSPKRSRKAKAEMH